MSGISGIAGAIGQVVSTGMNMVNANQDRQFAKGQAREADARALQNSMALSDHNQKNAMEMWRDTNYAAQAEEARKAGMSVGMLYGKGGTGGTAMSVGQTSQGTAGKAETYKIQPQEVANMMLMKAQKENIEADTTKKQVEADKLAGADTAKTEAETASLTQGITNQKAEVKLKQAQTYLTNIQNFNEQEMSEDKINEVMWNAQKAGAETQIALNEQYVSDATVKEKITIITETAVNAILKNKLDQATMNKVKQDIKNSIADIHLKSKGQDIEIAKATLTRKLGEAGLDIAQQKVVLDAMSGVLGQFNR